MEISTFVMLLSVIAAVGCDPRQLDPRWNSLMDKGVNTIPGEFHYAFFNEPVTDEQFAAAVPQLRAVGVRSLGLSETRITDASIDEILKLTSLKRLDVYLTQLTAEGLLRLAELPRLELLVIGRGEFTAQEVQKLKAAFPEVMESLLIRQMPSEDGSEPENEPLRLCKRTK